MLAQAPVDSPGRALELLREGDENRTTAATKLNAHSSRSHAAMIVHVERRERAAAGGGDGGVLLKARSLLA